MTLKQINQYETRDPDKLGRQLSAVEDNVHTECADIRASFAPVLKLRKVLSSPAASVIAAVQIDEQVRVDTRYGTATLRLPAVVPALFGRRIVILWVFGAAGTLTLACSGSDASDFVNLGRTAVISAFATTIYCCEDGYFF